jgi:hypothetical protein
MTQGDGEHDVDVDNRIGECDAREAVGGGCTGVLFKLQCWGDCCCEPPGLIEGERL